MKRKMDFFGARSPLPSGGTSEGRLETGLRRPNNMFSAYRVLFSRKFVNKAGVIVEKQI
jgi:hypothetical protein